MVNEIMEGILQSIEKEFGDRYLVIQKEGSQDREGPCFYVSAGGSAAEPLLGERSRRVHTFLVKYVPGTDEITECYDVRDRLFDCLEYVLAGERQIRYNGAEGEMEEGIMKVATEYSIQVVRRREQEDGMEELEVRGGIKVGE